jgi:antitoxin component YwqK of YwqJK toxin-antitoxin module
MNERTSRSPIPDDAIEVVTETWENGDKQRTVYVIDGKEIGFRYWGSSGALLIEFGLKDGIKHGLYRTWDEDGQIVEESTYYEGKEHGEAKQYDENGVQIGSYIMEYGTGTDLWFHTAGVLSEEREYRDGQRHGFERWWSGDNQTIDQESHFWNDIEHGIVRQWNAQKKLRRGYPQYYIMGKRVNKRQYERACRNDPTLPPFVAEDNQPFRKLPKGVVPSDQAP